MPSRFVHRQRVEFSETDMAGIVHYSRYFRYMEVAEHAFLRSLGTSVVGMDVAWPRVEVSCAYKAPLRFEDEIDVELDVVELKEKAITYGFTIVRVAPGPRAVVATGRTTVVSVAMDPTTGAMRAVPMPADFAAKLAPAAQE